MEVGKSSAAASGNCVPLPHDIGGLYCNFPHGCSDTDSCVYENPPDTSLEPPWHSRFFLRLQCVLLRGAADKGRLEGQLLFQVLGEVGLGTVLPPP